jgi:hypothetical protein
MLETSIRALLSSGQGFAAEGDGDGDGQNDSDGD